MKKTLLFIFVLYIFFFAGAGIFFYLQFKHNSFSTSGQSLNIEPVTPSSMVYYSKADVIYRIDTKKQTDPLEFNQGEQFGVQGEVGSLDIDKTNLLAVYDIKNANNNWEVWKAITTNFQAEKIAAKDQKDLEGFEDFSKPKFSSDNTKLAFLGSSVNTDVIFIKDMSTNAYTKLGSEISAKISDYSWNKDSSKIIFCSSSLLKNACFEGNLTTRASQKAFEAEVKKISWDKQDKILYLSKNETPHIYSLKVNDTNISQIDDVVAPKKVISFQIDSLGQKIAYELLNDQKSDIYISQIDGTNRLQLTSDGGNHQPIFSSDSKKLAFLRQKNGIYLIDTQKSNERKILNLEDTIDTLLLWR